MSCARSMVGYQVLGDQQICPGCTVQLEADLSEAWRVFAASANVLAVYIILYIQHYYIYNNIIHNNNIINIYI